MSTSRVLRWWVVALWSLCLFASVAGVPQTAAPAPFERPPGSAIVGLTGVSDAALLPARLADDVRVVAQLGGWARSLLLPAVLAALLGIPAARHRRNATRGTEHRPLQHRRYAIALRAPPLPLA